ncbi:MAG: MFS transporter [Deltaproteobacteria bacterium]|nr:MFS transporter [Deltaproteobacteria bacterium]
MSLSSLMATINSSSLNAVLPYLAKILHLTLNESQMLIVVYLVVLTSILTICGKFADTVGHKIVFLSGTLTFGLSALIVLIGETIELMVFMRIIQAIGASLMVASGPSILLEAFEPEHRGFAIGIHTTGISLGLIAGPPIGGFILRHLSWHWLFLINIPISFIVFAAISLIIPLKKIPNSDNRHYDLYGMLLWAIAIPTILISMSTLSHSPAVSLAIFSLGVGLIILFVKHELTVKTPFFPIHLIKIPAYYGGLFSLLFGYAALFIPNFLIPFYLKIVLGLEPHQTGLIMSITSIAMFATTGISGYLSDKIGYYKLCIAGMILLTAGLVILYLLDARSAIVQITVAQIVTGMGLGIFNSPNTTALINIGGIENAGITTGLLATMRNLGMSIGTVIAAISVSTCHLLIFEERIEKISNIPPQNFKLIFKYSMAMAFLISFISVYLSTIRKGIPTTSKTQK